MRRILRAALDTLGAAIAAGIGSVIVGTIIGKLICDPDGCTIEGISGFFITLCILVGGPFVGLAVDAWLSRKMT